MKHHQLPQLKAGAMKTPGEDTVIAHGQKIERNMTLQEIKEQYAKEKHYDNWNQLFLRGTERAVLKGFEETAKRYAKAKLEEAAERATVKKMEFTKWVSFSELPEYPYEVDKQSITNTPLD